MPHLREVDKYLDTLLDLLGRQARKRKLKFVDRLLPHSNGAEGLPTLCSELCDQLPLTCALGNIKRLGEQRYLLAVSCRTLRSPCQVIKRAVLLTCLNRVVREQIKIFLHPLTTDR